MKCITVLTIIALVVPRGYYVTSLSIVDDFLNKHYQNVSINDVQYEAVVQLIGRLFLDAIKHVPPGLNDTTISLNTVVDEAFGKFRNSFDVNSLDKLPLGDTHLKLSPVGHMDLTSGLLKDFSSFNRNGDVNITYLGKDKKIKLSFPFRFDKLRFTYRYNTHVTLLNVRGRVSGIVKNAMYYAEAVYDMVGHKFVLNCLNLTHLGDLALKFSGHNIMDWMINSMTRAASGVIQPLIINEVTSNLKKSVKKLLDDMNKEIAKKVYDYHE